MKKNGDFLLSDGKVIILSSILAALIGFTQVGFKSYWLDEIFTITITKNFVGMLDILRTSESNMWLYYFIVHFWTKLSDSEIWVRSLSVIFGTIAITPIFLIAKSLYDRKVAVLTLLLLPVNVYYVYFLQEARAYSLLLLLTSTSIYFLLKFVNTMGNKYLFLSIFFAHLSVYSHLYGLFMLPLITITLLYLTAFRKFNMYPLIYFALSLLSIIPIFLFPSFKNHPIAWVDTPKLTNIIGTFFALSGDHPILFIINTLLFAFFVLIIFTQYKKRKYLNLSDMFLLAWVFIPVIISLAESYLLRPIYRSTYFIMILPASVIICAKSLTTIKTNYLKFTLIAVISLTSIFRLCLFYSGSDTKWVFSNYEENWIGTTEFVMANSLPGDKVVFYSYFGRYPFEYYSNRYNTFRPEILELSSSAYPSGGGIQLPEPNLNIIDQLAYNNSSRIWLISSHSNGKQLDRSPHKILIENKLKVHYHSVLTKNFKRVTVQLYSK